MSDVKYTRAQKAKAGELARRAIAKGILVRPATCEKCGDSPPKCVNGMSRIHAHHHDYGKPLDVEWLCAKCHRADTPLPKVNGQTKLSDKAAREILKSKLSAPKLAPLYGVNKSTIQRIRNGQHWPRAVAKLSIAIKRDRS